MNGEAALAARAWPEKAASDLAVVQILLEADEAPLDAVCFHAQQAAEKSIKAVLTAEGLPFSKTHDLALLARCLPDPDALALTTDDWVELSYYAVGPRYPDDLIEYDRALAEAPTEKARRAYGAATRILRPFRDFGP